MQKKVTLRFYEELNDFLPARKRKISFEHTFRGNPSVKDVIETTGVPHVEVDLILVNGEPVTFGYILQNNDMVSVYPVFETLNVSGVSLLRPRPLRLTRFILDVHLGKLAKYLRVLGFDTLYRNDYADRTIAAVSAGEHRIILTRDLGLLKIKTVQYGYFLRSQNPKEQLNEVLKHFDLFDAFEPFTRCVKCNGKLETTAKTEIEDQLETLTKKYFDKFYRCVNCNSIFWEGSHYDRLRSFVESIRK